MSALSGSLLRVYLPEDFKKGKGVPLMMEFRVNPELSPFLVSSTKSVLWVVPRQNTVRAAVRQVDDLGVFYREVVDALVEKGLEEQWGNVQPLTSTGIANAIKYVRSYGLEDLEILVNPGVSWGAINPEWEVGERDLPMALFGVPLQPAVWLPPDTVVVVPRDRDYVGTVLLFEGRMVAVVHNGARGVGVAKGS